MRVPEGTENYRTPHNAAGRDATQVKGAPTMQPGTIRVEAQDLKDYSLAIRAWRPSTGLVEVFDRSASAACWQGAKVEHVTVGSRRPSLLQ